MPSVTAGEVLSVEETRTSTSIGDSFAAVIFTDVRNVRSPAFTITRDPVDAPPLEICSAAVAP